MSTEFAWTPDRVVHYPLITEVELSPDGEATVYAVREPVMSEEDSKFVTHLYLARQGRELLRLTYGHDSHRHARWSPDGRHIAFLSDRGESTDIWVMRADGGEAWPLTRVEKPIQAFCWAPDGQHLAFTMVTADNEEKKAAKKAKNDPILWDVDFERAQLWVMPFVLGHQEAAEPVALSDTDRHVLTLDWTPDGSAIAYTHQPNPTADMWPETGLALVRVQHGDKGLVRSETKELGLVHEFGPACKVYGSWVACATGSKPVSWSGGSRIMLYPMDGGLATPLALTDEARPYLLGWSADGHEVYVLESSGTSSTIRALPIDGGTPETLIEGPGYLSAVTTNGHDHFAFVTQEMDRPNRVCTWCVGDDAWAEVASPPASFEPLPPVARSEITRWRSTDGLEIEGIVTYPVDYQEGRAYPTLVIVHGGPAGVFSQTYIGGAGLYITAAFAERGYAVLRVNPRGSSGYGQTFRAANRGDWGGGDYTDIMSGVDELISRGIADPDRLGIMGWSYGGYMTSWTITQTRRFVAASVGAGVTNLMSFNGTSDIAGFIPDYFQAEYWENLDAYREHSAMFQIGGVTTPTLIQHGDSDVRVPLSQGRELYNALKRQGVEVEMVIYPRQPHGPNEPRLIMDVIQRNLDWFARWIPTSSTP